MWIGWAIKFQHLKILCYILIKNKNSLSMIRKQINIKIAFFLQLYTICSYKTKSSLSELAMCQKEQVYPFPREEKICLSLKI